MQREAAAVAAQAAAATGATPNPPDPFRMRQLTLEAQREFLLRRNNGAGAFSRDHPFVSGEIAIHPELQGRLPFNGPPGAPPTRTIPLRPDDYQRFKPEFWLNPMAQQRPQRQPVVAFRDLAVLQNELEVRRRNSQKKHNNEAAMEEEEFHSMPWEDIVLPPGMTSFAEKARKHAKKSSFASSSQPSEKQWFLKEKELKSMPPNLGTLNDSGIADDVDKSKDVDKTGTSRSSFGIILKDKFQKNPNVYFPADNRKKKSNEREDDEEAENSDDTLIHNMSEGSFEKEDSFTHSSGTSSLSPHNSMEGSPKMKMTTNDNGAAKGKAKPAAVKKTIRNYTPKESGNMLKKELEANRKKASSSSSSSKVEDKTSVEKMIEDFHKNLPPPSNAATLRQNNVNGGNGTMNSQVSNWSVASSSASFDYRPASKKASSSSALQPVSERVGPEGSAAAARTSSIQKHVQRIEVKAEVNRAKVEGDKDADEFSNLRKLISEGRIAGLNEKPPSFVPPTPPSVSKSKSSTNTSNDSSPKGSKNGARKKKMAPAVPQPTTAPKSANSSSTASPAKSRKAKEAPKPPMTTSSASKASSIEETKRKLMRESMEDLTRMDERRKRNAEIKRSPSNHETKTSK